MVLTPQHLVEARAHASARDAAAAARAKPVHVEELPSEDVDMSEFETTKIMPRAHLTWLRDACR
jgi:hypothetical protein